MSRSVGQSRFGTEQEIRAAAKATGATPATAEATVMMSTA
jgi:hypothetical protein